MQHRRVQLALLSFLCLIAIYIFFKSSSLAFDQSFEPTELQPANETLGFGAILVVSRAGSPRRESLIRAANLTELEMRIPPQPVWSSEDITALQAGESSTLDRGSALAWLGHLNALRWLLNSGIETALILEDDVDWDIHIRKTQIPRVGHAIRQMTSSKNSFYGNLQSWDILYAGHCGDFFEAERAKTLTMQTFPDESVPPMRKLHPFTQRFLSALNLGEKTRMVHHSVSPLCSFGYAVTRQSAQRLLNDLAGREPQKGCPAYDVRLLEACRDEGMRCWSVNPELFHHTEAPSEIAIQNKANENDPSQSSELNLKLESPNIECGARTFRWTEGRSFEYLRDIVGRQGRCLKDRMEEDMTERLED
ncbi:glycosyltransferase family 25 protein [Xylona heveae TC161]|uniref:Glycosyltransferase family 25 protein n=1 Tax=Xylona heveae (strain CBS 132557 / TC161) TaxID=1328760 RepID=A0A165H8Y9_XYLHT|nr:glycosyltransferase family 25 protein [Xylona heveae TC161]KZF23152.1 glycosyltransferase family 25 protein [Xylona heveae TC161]